MWPACPSNSSKPILLALAMDTVVAVPKLVRPVYPTWPVVKELGGTNRSPVLVAVPVGVFKEMCPEPAAAGTVIVMLVDVTDVGKAAGVMLRTSLSFCGAPSKFAPLIVTAPPGAAMTGAKLVIVGAADAAVTVKFEALVAEPAGEVTAMGPVVAPLGTVATS